jgi:bifunctional DNA-binding transcriptional regulator/antitoxin component of YhaV-PrlF toxin-antitoxin module
MMIGVTNMNFIINRSNPRQKITIPKSAQALSGIRIASKLELHILDGGVAVTKAEMSAMDMVNLIAALSNLVMDLGAQLALTCGQCDECGYCEAFCGDEPVRLPDYVLDEAGLPHGCKLEAYVDDDGNITVNEADYAYDLSDVPPDLLEVFRKSGVCVHELEERLMEDDIIYTGAEPDNKYSGDLLPQS